MLTYLKSLARRIGEFYSFKNPDSAQTRLIDLPSVRATYTACALLTVASLAIIIITSQISLRLDFEGLNNLPAIFKIPLSILALAIPIIALIASNHRSEQTKSQISMAESSANFSNYYKHTEEFENYVTEHDKELNIALPRKFHRKAFPEAKTGNFEVSINFKEDIDDDILKICERTQVFETEGMLYWPTNASNIRSAIRGFQKKYYLAWTPDKPLPLEGSPDYKIDSPMVFPTEELKDILKELETTTALINDALNFDETYTPSIIMKKINDFSFEELPRILSGQGVDMTLFNVHRRLEFKTTTPL